MKNLAKELGLSAPAVAERVKRLEQKGIIIAYKAIINREKLGQGDVYKRQNIYPKRGIKP